MNQRRGIIGWLQTLWGWSSEYPNLRLGIAGLLAPLFPALILAGVEGVYWIRFRLPAPQPIYVVGMFAIVIIGLLGWWVVMPLAAWMAIRDDQRRKAGVFPESDDSPHGAR